MAKAAFNTTFGLAASDLVFRGKGRSEFQHNMVEKRHPRIQGIDHRDFVGFDQQVVRQPSLGVGVKHLVEPAASFELPEQLPHRAVGESRSGSSKEVGCAEPVGGTVKNHAGAGSAAEIVLGHRATHPVGRRSCSSPAVGLGPYTLVYRDVYVGGAGREGEEGGAGVAGVGGSDRDARGADRSGRAADHAGGGVDREASRQRRGAEAGGRIGGGDRVREARSDRRRGG